MLLLYLFIHGFTSKLFSFRITFFLLEQTVFNVIQTFKTDLVESSTQSSLIIHNSCSINYPILCQEPSLHPPSIMPVVVHPHTHPAG